MLSICIPVYNVEMAPLLQSLCQQAEKLDVAVEIICIDDFSKPEIREKNRVECGELAQWVELKYNIGRAKIRNLFLNYAKEEYLLFLDCDVLIPSNLFLRNYIHFLKQHRPEIVCGGRTFPKKTPGRRYRLRWKYGHQLESKSAEIRRLNPNKSFMTNNFVISKKLFQHIRFDERISGYGHEDTLFGFELQKHNIAIVHLENPVMTGEYDDNKEFLEKTEQGLKNLNLVLKLVDFNPLFIDNISLLKAYSKLRKFHLLFLLQIVFIPVKPILKALLQSGFANMKLFSFYKLGLYTKIAKCLPLNAPSYKSNFTKAKKKLL